MTILEIHSRAKLNWYLKVLDQRPDGYHNLATVFHELAIHDVLRFTPVPEAHCTITGFPEDVPTEVNLIYRAWKQLRELFPGKVGGLEVHAEKRLPRGGGLGGGSSNAAAALHAMNQIFELGLTSPQLREQGLELGSDVPFFIDGECAIGHGRGENLQPIDKPGTFYIVLMFPAIALSTKEAFVRLRELPRNLSPEIPPELLSAVKSGAARKLSGCISNDFESVLAESEWFPRCQSLLLQAGALTSFLCGSGSTVAGLAESAEHAEHIVRRLHETCTYPVEATMTVRRQGQPGILIK